MMSTPPRWCYQIQRQATSCGDLAFQVGVARGLFDARGYQRSHSSFLARIGAPRKEQRAFGRFTQSWRSRQDRSTSKPQDAFKNPLAVQAINNAITRELRSRGDFRDPEDLSELQYEEAFIKSEALSVVDRAEEGQFDAIGPRSRRHSSHLTEGQPRPTSLCAFDPYSSTWSWDSRETETLKPGRILKVVSWNLFSPVPGPTIRASAALRHLQKLFGPTPDDLVIMLQQVHVGSLSTIQANEWIRQNFVLSDSEPPVAVADNGYPRQYFTLTMIPRNLEVKSCFRLPLPAKRERDALVLDVVLSKGTSEPGPGEVLRLCNTHLEPFHGNKPSRIRQLIIVSELLKGKHAEGSSIRAGLVGGDMNALGFREHEYHLKPEINLVDVWDGKPMPKEPRPKPSDEDSTHGRAAGNTWGYHEITDEKSRLAKFLYTGSVETFPVVEAQDVTGKLGRFGIGLKTNVKTQSQFVSDSFGIVVGIAVV